MNTLQSITNFDELLTYLGEELEWPVEDYELDELVFEYDADELGLKDEEAEKLKGGKIRQLRPLAGSQPFGIFFVEFGKKKLPIVVLRRILSQLVIKKRANAAEAKRWDAADLLFISAFGEAGEREIAFAHFHKEPESAELPILRVLGWDGADTPLKLDHVAGKLSHHLKWPEDASDQDAWREQWRAAFRHRPGHVIKTASALAETLAEFAKRIRDAAATIIAHESEEKGHLKRLHRGFRDALIHDLTEEDFADTYAQTVTYGLLTAAVSRTDPSGAEGTALSTGNITDMVPVTNPFLKEMLEEFLKAGGRKGAIDFDELGIQDVVELLRDPDRTDLASVLLDFGKKKQGEDPVIHFYEHFLAAYNKKLRVQRGVFYTPQPVVSYIVRSVHELLQTEFGLEYGLASVATWAEMLERNTDLKLPPLTDEDGETKTISAEEFFVQILDPATGTATFPVEVIYKHLSEKWEQGGLAAMPELKGIPQDAPMPKQFVEYWQHYVPLGLLPRLYGYELLMAPYAIAHMKIGLKLHETGYRFGSDERARIYLTNALEPKVKQLPQIGFDALAHEAAAVNEVKWYKRFTVVIGNPPYSNFGQLNRIPFILGLLEDYKHGLDEKKLNLDDDYIKFVRFAQWLVATARVGIVGMITNNSFLDGLSHRRMRETLRETFDKIATLDLGGSVMRGEVNGGDENVFDIQQGVAIGIFRTCKTRSDLGTVEAGRLGGARETKYKAMDAKTVSLSPIVSAPPYHFFVAKKHDQDDPYLALPSYKEIFEVFGPGIKAERDAVAIHCDREAIETVVSDFQHLSESDIRSKYGLNTDSRDWTVPKAKADTIANAKTAVVTSLQYRPFDYRWTWYSGKSRGFIGTPGSRVAQQMLRQNNLGLITNRQIVSEEFSHILVSNLPISHGTFYLGNKGQDYLAPLYLSSEDNESQAGFIFGEGSGLNFTDAFLKRVSLALRLKRPKSSVPDGLTPEDIFHYIYAVFHSPGYRKRYAEFLKIDFPRLPLTSSLELFRELARLGRELTALHLLESPKLDKPITKFIGDNTQISKVGWTPDNGGTVWLDGKKPSKKPFQAGTSGFAPVPEEVWNFHIGGYQVCEKWLKDRGPKKGKPGRILTKDDIAHYHKIVIALTETICLMSKIDQVIETHGGWPGAFQTESSEDES